MTTAIEKATAHFRAKLAAPLESITVPEWDGLKIYFKQTLTLKEQSKLVELAQAGKTTEALVETLITKARTEDGTKMFNSLDKAVFMNEVDPAVLVRVVGALNKVDDDVNDLEEIEKN